MKHYLHHSLRALFLFLAVFLSLPILAEQVEIDGINYELITKVKQATVIAKNRGKYSGDIVIPESVEYRGTTCRVTSIGDKAFYDCSGLTSVTIGNRVTNIGGQAFYGCSSLTSVTIPNSVTSIGEYAFCGCSGLTSVTIGNSVTSIGDEAFRFCKELTSVHIFDIAAWCNIDFANDDSNPLRYAYHLYVNGEEVKDLIIPNSVTSIGKYAFFCCSGLTSVTIPNSVTSIGNNAFFECWGLTSVHISDIAAWCNIEFHYTNPLSFAHHLYLNGEEVKDLVIPNSVTSIGNYAFYGCSGLTSVTIPNSVTSIGNYAFDSCSGLTSVTIPNSVTSIGGGAFSCCFGLTSVTIPNSVTSIGERAFLDCSGLTSVTIPNSVTSIGGQAFFGCFGLTSVTIGNGVKNIGKSAFAECEELLDIYCYAEEVPTTKKDEITKKDVFDGSYIEYATLHVPDASLESYKTTAPWSGFGKIVSLSKEEPEVKKCVVPVLTYADGSLEITCETEGAEFITNIVAEDAKKHYGAKIGLNAIYNIEVYASKENYENSDTVNVALVWVENGKVGEESGVISVEAVPVLIQANGGNLTINGVAKGCEIVVYTLNGTEVTRATATEGSTTINTGLQSGTVAIVKLGNKSVKIKI